MYNYNFRTYDHSKGISPCKDCKDRHIGCHAHCKKYKAYRREINETKNL